MRVTFVGPYAISEDPEGLIRMTEQRVGAPALLFTPSQAFQLADALRWHAVDARIRAAREEAA